VKDRQSLAASRSGITDLAVWGIRMSADHWPDDIRLSEIESGFTCSACGKRGAEVRPDFDWHLR
jgi:hypothetical protein